MYGVFTAFTLEYTETLPFARLRIHTGVKTKFDGLLELPSII
jgi:hypothetical protein